MAEARSARAAGTARRSIRDAAGTANSPLSCRTSMGIETNTGPAASERELGGAGVTATMLHMFCRKDLEKHIHTRPQFTHVHRRSDAREGEAGRAGGWSSGRKNDERHFRAVAWIMAWRMGMGA